MPPRPGAVAAAAAELPASADEAPFDEVLFDEAAFLPWVLGPPVLVVCGLVVCGLVTDCFGAVAIADKLSTSGLVSVCSTAPGAVLPTAESREITRLLPLVPAELGPLLTLVVLVVSGAAVVATLAAVSPAEPGAAQARVADLTATRDGCPVCMLLPRVAGWLTELTP
jgi:hypothetical protein